MKNTIILSAAACLFLWSCKPKLYTLDNLPERRIIFGEGGGFSGKYTEWLLPDSGQIFEKDGFAENYTEVGLIDKKTIKSLYKSADSLFAEQADAFVKAEPGNYNYKLVLQQDTNRLEAAWSNAANINPQIVEYYKKLWKTVDEVKKSSKE